jgi:hypothetical protein
MNLFDRGLPLNDNDCIEFENNKAIRFGKFKSAMGDLNEMIQDEFERKNLKFSEKKYTGNHPVYSQNFLEEGVPCEILKVNSSGWKKGKLKIRVSVEFYPDEPEAIDPPASPLDDIRQNMS